MGMSTVAALQTYLRSWNAAGCLHGVAAVCLADGERVAVAGGMADPGLAVANEPDTVFRIGSLSKSFTAAAVLQQVAQGRLELSDSLERFFPDFPNAAGISLHQLLNHSAGTANFTSAAEYWPTRMRLAHRPQELLDWAHALPPACPPGIAHAYSNTGYLLLAAIVERVADQDFSSYRQQYLLRPLGLERTFVDDGRVILPQAARGLHPGAPWRYAEPMDMSVAWGVYDLASSAGDLCRWLEALQRGEALPARLAALMLDVSALEYAYGFYGEDWVLAGRQLRLAQHFGDVNGFFSFMSVLPGGGGVVVLANAFGSPVERLGRDLARIASGEEWEALPAPGRQQPDEQLFVPGRYESGDGAWLELFYNEHGCYARSPRRYGVPIAYPLTVEAQTPQLARSAVLPETLLIEGGTLQWRDAEGETRRLRRQ